MSTPYNGTYGVSMSALRVRGGHERDGMRDFGPTAADHPIIGHECAVCGVPIYPGDHTTVIPLGPGPDLDDQAKARRGGWYSAIGVIGHAGCAGVGDG